MMQWYLAMLRKGFLAMNASKATTVICLLLHFIGVGALQAQESPWLGKKVILKAPTPLKVDEQTVDDGTQVRLFTVKQVDGTRLLLVDKPLSGWVDAATATLASDGTDFFKEQVQKNPRDVDAHLRLAFLQIQQKDFESAKRILNDALILDFQNCQALLLRCQCWEHFAKWENAFVDVSTAVRLHPECQNAQLVFANVLRQTGQYKKALAVYSECLQKTPQSSELFAFRAECHAELGNPRNAIADYSEALRLNPLADIYQGRAQVWDSANHYEQAILDYSEDLKRHPQNVKSLQARGTCYLNLSDHAKAEADLTSAIEMAPSDHNYMARSALWLDQTQYDKALTDVNAALEINPELEQALVSRAKIRLRLNDIPAATEELTNAIQLNPNSSQLLFARGKLWSHQHQYEKAITDFYDALKFDRNNKTYLLHRARAWHGRGNYRNAVTDYNTVLHLENFNIRSLVGRTQSFYKQKVITPFLWESRNVFHLLPRKDTKWEQLTCRCYVVGDFRFYYYAYATMGPGPFPDDPSSVSPVTISDLFSRRIFKLNQLIDIQMGVGFKPGPPWLQNLLVNLAKVHTSIAKSEIANDAPPYRVTSEAPRSPSTLPATHFEFESSSPPRR